MTINETNSGEGGSGDDRAQRTVGRLVLRATAEEPPKSRSSRRVVWSEGTVDNEGMGKKKSKSEHIMPFSCADP